MITDRLELPVYKVEYANPKDVDTDEKTETEDEKTVEITNMSGLMSTKKSGEKKKLEVNQEAKSSEEKPIEMKVCDESKSQHKKNDDPMAKELTCTLCSKIFYKCITLNPCLHNFCAPCYSEWMVIFLQQVVTCFRKTQIHVQLVRQRLITLAEIMDM